MERICFSSTLICVFIRQNFNNNKKEEILLADSKKIRPKSKYLEI
jgi:hypothetical protein